MLLSGCGKQSEATMPRDQFKNAIMGKSQQAVIQAVGKPDMTGDIGGEYWAYINKTVDPVTGKLDSGIHVWFESGRVSRVSY